MSWNKITLSIRKVKIKTTMEYHNIHLNGYKQLTKPVLKLI